jgi:P3 major capsid protein
MAAAQPQYSAQQNLMARNAILSSAREMWQITNTNTVPAPIVGVPQNIQLRNIGMCKRLLLEVTGTVTSPNGANLSNLTKMGLANIFSQVIVTDLANYNRIQTTGAHLYALATLRRQMAYGGAFINDAPVAMGSNISVNNGPPSALTTGSNFRMFFELPLAYSDTDLRGAIYSAVVNATWQVQYTINPNFFVAAGADPTNAVYQSVGATLGTLSNVVVKTHQIYLDQLPFSQNGQPILPYYDLATGYLIQNSTLTNPPAVGMDYPIQYPNFRSILSAFLQIDNGGQQLPGTDINYIGIQAANLVYLLQVDANTIALRTRNSIGDDYPSGNYMLETRMAPINTTAYGNMQIVLNMSTVNNPFAVGIGWEMLAIINSVAGASSLPAG